MQEQSLRTPPPPPQSLRALSSSPPLYIYAGSAAPHPALLPPSPQPQPQPQNTVEELRARQRRLIARVVKQSMRHYLATMEEDVCRTLSRRARRLAEEEVRSALQGILDAETERELRARGAPPSLVSSPALSPIKQHVAYAIPPAFSQTQRGNNNNNNHNESDLEAPSVSTPVEGSSSSSSYTNNSSGKDTARQPLYTSPQLREEARTSLMRGPSADADAGTEPRRVFLKNLTDSGSNGYSPSPSPYRVERSTGSLPSPPAVYPGIAPTVVVGPGAEAKRILTPMPTPMASPASAQKRRSMSDGDRSVSEAVGELISFITSRVSDETQDIEF